MARTKSILLMTAAVGLIHAQTSKPADADTAQLLQLLMKLQQSNGTQAAAAPAAGQAAPSADQVRLLLQMLGQNSAAASPTAATASTDPGAPASAPAESAFAVQNGQRVPIAIQSREIVFIKSKSNDVADALKAQAMSQAISVGSMAAARKLAGSVPYFAPWTSMAGKLGMFGSGKQKGFEFEFLRGTTASVQLKPEDLEFVIPPALAAATAGSGFEPVLVRLKTIEQDKVRIVASRRIEIGQATSSAFGSASANGLQRDVLSTDFQTVATQNQRTPDGAFVLKPASPLQAGEYAIAFHKPEPKSMQLLDSILSFRIAE